MTPEVLTRLAELRPLIANLPQIALLSPSKEERALFPHAIVLTRKDWDLDERRPDLRFDLIIACNVFHYAEDALAWFDNVTASCRAFLITDLIRRKRSAGSELGPDHDRIRYAFGAHRPVVDVSFDLSRLGARLLACQPFDGAANEYGPAKHFWGLVQGQLSGPLIRLDSYREAAREPRALASILSSFREHAFGVHLGIEAGALSSDELDPLRALERFEPAIQAEPGPWRPRWQRESALILAKKSLEHRLERFVRTYIPARGALDRFTARMLGRLGFELCLCDQIVDSRYFRSRRADFAGSSTRWGTRLDAEVVTLHLPSELELRARDASALPRVLEQVAQFNADKVRAISNLASAFAS